MRRGSILAGDRRISSVLWSRFALRHWRQEPGLTALLVGILALGVAVFLAVRLANKAAVSGFSLFTESVAGESDFLIRSPAGPLGVGILRDLRRASGTDAVGLFPVLEVPAVDAKNPEGAILRLVGADLVALQNAANDGGSAAGSGPSLTAEESGEVVLGREDMGFVGEAFARARNLEPGDEYSLLVNDRPVPITVQGILQENPTRPAVPDNLILMDLPGLQKLVEEEGALSRVEIRVPLGAERGRVLERTRLAYSQLAERKDLIMETPEDRKSSVTRMSAAFRMNLTILSGLALVVGVYLIMQAMEAAVVKRRAEIAILRALGVTPRQIRRAWLLESLVLGAAGAAVGILLGRLLATGLVGAIARTVDTMYHQTTTSSVTLGWGEVLFSLSFGIAASVVAGFLPAREAAATPPAQAVRQGVQGGGLALLRKKGVGLTLLVVGIACAWLPPFQTSGGTLVPAGGYLAAIVLVVSLSILVGILFTPLSGLLGGREGDPMRRYAASQLRRPGGRHRLTAAGLAVAVGMSAAMGILVASFEHTLTSWIGQLLKADIYVAAAGSSSAAGEGTISPETWRRLGNLRGVAGMDKLRRYTITVEEREVFLAGSDYHGDARRRPQLVWLDAPDEPGPEALRGEEGSIPLAWISEPFARRLEAGKGDVVEFPTPAGTKSARVAGVYADYGNEFGTILLSRHHTSRWFQDDSVSRIAVYLEGGKDAEKVLETIRGEFPALVSRTNARLRSESLRIFHQTFAVTYALEAIAVVIAVAGLGLAMTGLLLERKNELATLRSLGASRRSIARAAAWEGSALAAAGLAGGFAISFLLGWILIFVVNPQSFGWTLAYRIPWLSFAGLTAVTLAVAAAVAWAVGHRNANLRSDRED